MPLLSLIIYELLSQMAAGLALTLTLAAVLPGWKAEQASLRVGWCIAMLLVGTALGFLLWGQGPPEAIFALIRDTNLRDLRLDTLLFLGLLLCSLLLVRRETTFFAWLAALAGLSGVVATALRFEGLPLSLRLAAGLLGALSLGPAYGLRFLAPAAQTPVRQVLSALLLAGVAVHMLVFFEAGQSLGAAFPSRPLLFWAGLGLAYAAPLILLRLRRPLPELFPWIMLFGMILLREQWARLAG